MIESPAFREGDVIPVKYTCDGEDMSSPLKWRDVPSNAKSIAIICEDPDAPLIKWIHWIIYNIPPEIGELNENIPKKEEIEGGIRQGKNSWNKFGYGGPCPPGKKPHRYYFRMYALDIKINVQQPLKKRNLLKLMEGHIIEEAELMGKYSRK
ncbi:MAG TPA: YbhB/YbcL family Raf kinase inhibitor-like protein [Thermoplasmatales archaeon]|nr:YbhB/YbcL family Raf kinase inhibitor-like protein [Thermoplasmatales archaeon]